jgi:hypothetical protein
MQEEIRRIGSLEERTRDFILLLNFMDFLESIAYYTRRRYIESEDMYEMFGGNLPYWFNLFEAWIKVTIR